MRRTDDRGEQGDRSVLGELLGNARLARLLSAFAALTLSEWTAVTALSIYAYRVDGALGVGLVGFRFVPGALSSALLAPIVDHRGGILTRIAVARMVLIAAAAGAVAGGLDLALVIVLMALDATIAAPYRPAQSRLLPTLARTPRELTAAAAGISMAKTLGQALGAVAGGLAVAVVAPSAAIAGAAVLMALAAMLSTGLNASTTAGGNLALLRAGIDAIPHVFRHREAAPLVLASGLRTLTRGLWTALLVVVALRMLRLGPSGVGLLSGAVGVGALAGLPLAGSMIGRSRLGKPCALSFIGVGVTVSLVGAAGVTTVIAVLAACWGASMAVSDSTSLSLLTRLLDSSTLTRTVGVMESLKLGAEGVGALVAPALVGLFGIRPALVLAGLPLPLLVVFAVPRMRRADDVAVDRGRLVSLLHGVSVFRALDMASLETLAASRETVLVPAGDAVLREGEPGDRFFVIEAGEAEVVVQGFPIGRVGAGEGFGERALLRNAVRTATVRALTPLALLAFDRAAFLYAVTGRPGDAHEPAGPPSVPTGPDARSRTVPDMLADQAPFRGLPRSALERIASAAIVEHWSTGADVIREGDAGDAMFVVLSGRAHAVQAGVMVVEFLPGDCFGQIAALHSVTRTATVTALEPLTTCRIASEALRSVSDS